MSKNVLITSTDVMMFQFLLPHVGYLAERGYNVDVACSFANGYEQENYHDFIRKHLPTGSHFYSVPLGRSPFKISNKRGLNTLKRILGDKHYDLVWTNEPVMGVMTRLASKNARKAGTKVLYMVHGYHFYKGCPKMNWLAYPVEKWMSKYCDAICTICWEDYFFTKKHMPKTKVMHIDGIGFDHQRFASHAVDRESVRYKFGISKDDILLLSVGELQKRKNHEAVIKALGLVDSRRIKYLICGQGELKQHLMKVAEKNGVLDKLILPGHLHNISDVLQSADVFVHPSLREGLGIAALEAMASGLPLITSDVQGIKDYMVNEKTGFVHKPFDSKGYARSIELLCNDPVLRKQIGLNNISSSKKYDISFALKNVEAIIENLLQEQ